MDGRSGNRGKCAQSCRLPYSLLENNKKIDEGYLISPKDLCGLDFIPDLISTGVSCLKIEGRMKNPEYVATVTRIYRKYIDLAESYLAGEIEEYKVSEKDRKILLQVFNRGMSSEGHLSNEANEQLIYKEKSNNMGLYLGKVEKYNKTKGYITIKLNEPINIGDTVSLQNEEGTYNVSELMLDNKNITNTIVGQRVVIGRMKGNINLGDKVYKMSSKKLNKLAKATIKNEAIKIPLKCKAIIKKDKPIKLHITFDNNAYNNKLNNSNIADLYADLKISCKSEIKPDTAISRPLDKEKVLNQLNKTGNSIFKFNNIDLELDDNLFLPKISVLNEMRRKALDSAYEHAVRKIKRGTKGTVLPIPRKN